ncbi:MAG TPA: M48 family metallopeptidase [Polyangiaceae bacterium]
MLPLLTAYVLVTALSCLLGLLNLRHLRKHGHRVPAELAGSVDPDRLRRISEYTADRARLGLVSSLASSAVIGVFVFGGLLERYAAWVSSLTSSFVIEGIVFFLLLSLAETVLSLPVNWYATFRVEARHGFNRTTSGLFWADLAKGLVISSVLLVITAAAAFWLIAAAPETWWLWVWGLFVALSIALLYLGPYVIEPLFFKMEPIRTEGLVEEVRSLAERAGVHVNRVLTIDASRRSAHSNAYFTGIGRVKRVVLFDTLLEHLSQREILSVLSHELGHWQKRHILKRIVGLFAVSLAVSFAAFHLSAWSGLPGLVGANEASFPMRLVILALAGSLLSFLTTPLSSWFSRRHEWEADRFATQIWGAPDDLASALVKLSRENLANLHPHPWYAAFYYTHPPITERVRSLRASAAILPSAVIPN